MFINRSNHVAKCIKRSRVFLLCFIMFSLYVTSQVNLVVDPSFEIHDTCNQNQEVIGTKNWHALDSTNNTYMATSSCTPAYFNACCVGCITSLPFNLYTGPNFQYPRTGKGMYGMGMYLLPTVNQFYNRDYLRGRLRESLITNKQYCGKFYVNLFDTQYYGIDRIGAVLDNGALDINNECLAIIANPNFENPAFNYITDTVHWTKIQGVFTANGTEKYITIGNFYSEANTHKVIINLSSHRFGEAYYYVDDVSVIPIEITAFAGNDATICLGDSILLGRPQETGIECEWYKPGNPVPFNSNSSLRFKADSVGTYTFVQRMDNCKISFDTVTVKVIQDCHTTLQIPNVFTPNEDGVNDAWYFEIKNATNVRYSIYNRWGNLVKDSDLPNHTFVQWDGRTTAGEACSAGVYYYVLSYTDVKGEAQKKNGYITLIK